MKKIVFCIATVLGTSLCSSVLAYETRESSDVKKERQGSSYDAKGIRLGAFDFHPLMAFGSEYDSNIFKRNSANEVASYVAHFQPGFMMASDWSRHAFNASVKTDLTVFTSQPKNNNYQDVFVSLDGRLDILKDSFFEASYNFNSIHEDRGSADQAGGITPTFYNVNYLNLSYQHKFNRLKLEPEFSVSRYDYQDTLTSLGFSLQNHTRNRWEYKPSMRVGYELKPGYEAFTKFTWLSVDYNEEVITGYANTVLNGAPIQSFDRNSSGYNILAGMEFDLTDLITGDVSIGYLSRDYADNQLQSISGVNGFLNLLWQPSALTGVLFNFTRDIQETTQSGVSGMFITSPSITITHELRRNIIFSLGTRYSFNEYRGFNAANPIVSDRTNRLEHVVSANTGIKYLVNRYLSLELNYVYDTRETNYTGVDYDVHQVMFNILGQI